MRQIDKRSDTRTVAIIIIAGFWAAYIGLTLVRLQLSEHDWLTGHAEREQLSIIGVSPVRGLITDRSGREMARSIPVKSLYAAPSEVGDATRIADKLSSLLGVDRDEVYQKLAANQPMVAVNRKQMVAIKRRLTDAEMAAINALKAPGLHFVDEMKRVYLNGPVAAQVMGFVDAEEKGRGGIEQSYDKVIRGSQGKLLETRDALKKAYDHETEQTPTPGASVSLTIDTEIQARVEQILKEAVRSNGARGGTIVIIRPSTGEILAMADYPTFDPNQLTNSAEEGRRNRAVEVAFEPGSVFKLVTYSAALNERLIDPKTPIDVGNGELLIAGHVVHDENHGVLTAAQALARSSNIAAIRLGQRLGVKRVADYATRFGFGKRTGVELPGESHGLMQNPEKWDDSILGSVPMGYGVGVTALQAVSALGAVANGGELVRPFIVNKVTAADGSILEQHHDERRRVIAESTANTLKSMLEGVVIFGTGKRAKLGGYSAAGKTGTAHKIDRATGRYSPNRYVASFAGFAPVEAPEIACIVSIDEPKGRYYGGDVSAPVFARVASEVLPMLGVDPEDHPNTAIFADDLKSYQIPEDQEMEAAVAVAKRPEPTPAAQQVARELPKPAAAEEGSITVPDFVGMGIREAAALCASQRLRLKVQGEGIIVRQEPAAGTPAAPGFICQVSLSRNPDRKDKGVGVALTTASLESN